MALKNFKPYTKSTRGTVLINRDNLWKGKPYKSLTSANYSSKGRNNYGRITSRNHGGGHKHKYRQIDFYRKKFDISAKVERIEYDPNRSCHIMLVKFEDNQRFYYLAPQKVKVGDDIQNGSNSEIKVGNCLPLKDIPVGIDIHNVEIQPGAGGKIARAAGSSVTISGIDGNYSIIKMASRWGDMSVSAAGPFPAFSCAISRYAETSRSSLEAIRRVLSDPRSSFIIVS